MGNCLCGTPESSRDGKIGSNLRQGKKEESQIKKLLLLGAGGSGKSTFFKQLKDLYGGGIPKDDLSNHTAIVYSNITTAMKTLVDRSSGMELRNYKKKTLKQENAKYAEFIINLDEDDFLEVREKVNEAILNLWDDESIKETWDLRSKFQIQDSAQYFFSNVQRITQASYIPTSEDVLRARIRTTGIVEQNFTMNRSKFQVFDVGGQRNERKKWIHCFENVTGVIFLAALSAYDQTLYEDDQTNRMKEALMLFNQICNSRWFRDTCMILFLNKIDLFKEKIKRVPLSTCFLEYNPPENVSESQIEKHGKEYIKKQFEKQNLGSKTKESGIQKKKVLYVHYTCAIDKTQMQSVFKDVQMTIVHRNLQKAALI